MGEKLKNPPLIEAVCEFRWVETSPWDWTIPGQLFERIKEDFPDRSELGFAQPRQADDQGANIVQTVAVPLLVRLSRRDGSAIVQIGQRLLSVNCLKPYPTWESFKSLIIQIYGEYSTVAEPTALDRVGLRYINRMDVPEGDFQIEDYLNMGCSSEWLTKYPFASFYQRYEVVMSSPDRILVHQTALDRYDGKRAIMLDLDIGMRNIGTVETGLSLDALLDAAHDKVLEAFVSSVNPDLYERMKRGDQCTPSRQQ